MSILRLKWKRPGERSKVRTFHMLCVYSIHPIFARVLLMLSLSLSLSACALSCFYICFSHSFICFPFHLSFQCISITSIQCVICILSHYDAASQDSYTESGAYFPNIHHISSVSVHLRRRRNVNNVMRLQIALR